MGLIIVPLTNLCYLMVSISKKKLKEYVPLWLVTSNILFLLILVYYIFKMND
jgi:hypothetical protein